MPVKDVRAIDFGLHFPEGVGKKSPLAMKNLASNSYQDREDAKKTFFELGPFSYPAVYERARKRILRSPVRPSMVQKAASEIPQDPI